MATAISFFFSLVVPVELGLGFHADELNESECEVDVDAKGVEHNTSFAGRSGSTFLREKSFRDLKYWYLKVPHHQIQLGGCFPPSRIPRTQHYHPSLPTGR